MKSLAKVAPAPGDTLSPLSPSSPLSPLPAQVIGGMIGPMTTDVRARYAPPLAPLAALAALILLAACQPAGEGNAGDRTAPDRTAKVPAGAPGDDSTRPYDGIAPAETLRFTGTEPFWGGEVAGDTLTYTTPDNQAGETVAVSRFAGRGGVSFAGTWAGGDFAMTVTPGQCSDGMSDRTYPFTVTLKLADETLGGCGWTDRQPATGPPAP